MLYHMAIDILYTQNAQKLFRQKIQNFQISPMGFK